MPNQHVAPGLSVGKSDGIAISHTLNRGGVTEDGTGRGVPLVAFDTYNQSVSGLSPSLRAAHGTFGDALPAVAYPQTVRRITPLEAERLQGFPDDYTLIPYRGKPAADGPRYKALGNSMAVPVMRWIGARIEMQHQ